MTDATFTQEQLDDAVTAAVERLQQKNNDLIGERRADGEKITAAQQAIEAANKVASDAKKAQLANDQKWDELSELHAKELATATATSQQLQELAESRLNKIHSDNAINEVLSNVDDRFKPFVKTQLASITKVSYNEQGEAVTTITDGDKQFTSVADFLGSAKESDTWKSVLKGVDSSGADTKNSNGGGAAFDSSKPFSSQSMAQKKAYMEAKHGQ